MARPTRQSTATKRSAPQPAAKATAAAGKTRKSVAVIAARKTSEAPAPRSRKTLAHPPPAAARKSETDNQKRPRNSPVRNRPKKPVQKKQKVEIVDKDEKVVERTSFESGVHGCVLTVGQGDVGQLGLGEDVLEKTRPGLVASLPPDVAQVEAGGMHTVCLTKSGEVYTFGCNDDGALGRSTAREGSETTPGRVTLDGPAAAVSAGDSHTAALMTDGRVFAWGSFRDSSGLMGLTGAGPQPSPTQLLESVRVAQIASGSDHLACLSDGGDIYTCGCAEQGQLGRVAEVFAKRGGRRGLGFVLEPGIVHCKRVRGKTIQFDKIWAGQYVTFARSKASGDVYAFGLNNYCQLGLPQKVHSAFMPQQAKTFDNKCWVKINGGQHHTLALDDQGRVYSLGRKEYGRLGLGEEGDDQASPTLLTSLSGVTCTDVACGSCVSYAVTEEGAAYAWGMGTNGQLGNGNDDDDRWTPERMSGRALQTRAVLRVSAGGQHSVLLAGDRPPAAAAPGDPSQVSSTTDAAGLRPGVAENGVVASACNEAVPATASS